MIPYVNFRVTDTRSTNGVVIVTAPDMESETPFVNLENGDDAMTIDVATLHTISQLLKIAEDSAP